MPQEAVKEAAKVIVETSGSFSEVWAWATGGLGAVGAALWGHVTGRLKKIEGQMVTAAYLKEHVDDENKKFEALFTKHDAMINKVGSIAESVARIEGKLDQQRENGHG